MKWTLLTALIAPLAAALISPGPARAEIARPGWASFDSAKSYDALVAAIPPAAKAQAMGVVTQAGPTGAARARGIAIPGNRVIGIFNNSYAVRILGLSTAAMIEAPIRLYVTENPDGTGTLSYKPPSHIFAPYLDEGGPELAVAAAELDQIFAAIAAQALAAE